MAMPPDLDAAFRKFIPPFGAAGNPVDITGGEPPKTYQNTVRLGLEDPRIHALILGYWHTIVTPPMVFAKLVAEVVEEMQGEGHRQADRRLARGRRRGRGGRRVPVRPRHSGLSVLDRDAGRGARRQVQVGARRRGDAEGIPQRSAEPLSKSLRFETRIGRSRLPRYGVSGWFSVRLRLARGLRARRRTVAFLRMTRR